MYFCIPYTYPTNTCEHCLKGKKMNSDKKFETSSIDDIKALFENRKEEDIVPPDAFVETEKPVVTKEAVENAIKRSSPENISKRKRNRIIANTMIYSGIGLLIVACAILVALIFAGNNGNSITNLDIINGDEITLRAGHSQQLKIKTEPAGTEYALSYISADTSIATVSLEGKVTAVKNGKTEITVSSGDLSDTITVNVKKDIIESLDVSLAALSLDGGEEQKVEARVAPADAKDVKLSWKSADSEVASVDNNGTIKGVNTGETTVTVTDSVTGLSKDITVTVNGLELPESMKFEKDSVTLEKIGDVYKAVLKFTPEDITYTGAIYYTSDATIASVTNEGVITAKAAGTCTIEAYYENDYRLVATMEVTVIDSYVITDQTTVPETPATEPVPDTETDPPASSKPAPTPDYTGSHKKEVIDGITYFDGVMIANKTYTLPRSYDPGVQPVAMDAFYDMQAAAASEGISLWILSSYRSYDDQEVIYNRYVAQDGRDAADTYSSRPGHSDHQTGYTFDLNSLEQDFQYDPAGQWLEKNCYKYGFIIRYPKGKDSSTGYMYEPWHVRYIGVDLATKVTESGLSLEEYFGITSQYQD